MTNWIYGSAINEALYREMLKMEHSRSENFVSIEAELKHENSVLQERISYLEAAILELEGDKNA